MATEPTTTPVTSATLDAAVETPKVTPETPKAPESIGDATKRFRERLERIATEPETPTEPEDPDGQPRKPNGQFAPKDGEPEPVGKELADEPEVEGEPLAEGEEPVEGEAETEDAEPEPEKVLLLKGEEQRGEEDIELDLSGLPPEAVERLELLQRNGLRRQEYNREMQKVRTLRSDLDAVETEIAVDSTGFVLSRVPPAKRADLAQALLLDQWEVLAPMIEELWQDPVARSNRMGKTKETVEGRRTEVVQAINAAQQASEVREAVEGMIPDRVPDEDAREFFMTSISLLQNKANSGEVFTPADVPKLLASHRRRFFGAGEVSDSPKPPARPKLAVRNPSSNGNAKAASQKSTNTTHLTPEQVRDQIRRKTAAKAVASQGAGGAAVQRPAGPANETVEQASRRIREQARLSRAG